MRAKTWYKTDIKILLFYIEILLTLYNNLDSVKYNSFVIIDQINYFLFMDKKYSSFLKI